MADFSDNFDRANSTNLGANWNEFASTPAGDWQILTNQLRTPSTAFPATLNIVETTTTAHAALADCEVAITRKAGTSYDGGPCLRKQSGADTCYYIDASGTNTWQLYRRVAGTDVAVGSPVTQTHAVNDIYALRGVGTTFKMKQNGTQVGSDQTDSGITAAGATGVTMWSGAADVDNFAMTDLTVTGGMSYLGVQVGNRNVGPMALRRGSRSAFPPIPDVAPVTDDHFGSLARVPNNRVGPQALRRLYRPLAYPFDSTNAPVTDTEFGTRVRIPNNRVGPMALRALYRSISSYPFDSTVAPAATGNRRRRVICSGA